MKWNARFRQFDRRYFAGALGHAGWNVTSRHKVVAWDIDEEGVEIRTYAYRASCGQIRRFQVDENDHAITIPLTHTIVVLFHRPEERKECDRILLHEMAHAYLYLTNPANADLEGEHEHDDGFRDVLLRLIDAGATVIADEWIAYTPHEKLFATLPPRS